MSRFLFYNRIHIDKNKQIFKIHQKLFFEKLVYKKFLHYETLSQTSVSYQDFMMKIYIYLCFRLWFLRNNPMSLFHYSRNRITARSSSRFQDYMFFFWFFFLVLKSYFSRCGRFLNLKMFLRLFTEFDILFCCRFTRFCAYHWFISSFFYTTRWEGSVLIFTCYWAQNNRRALREMLFIK